jgi:hypothetical protein
LLLYAKSPNQRQDQIPSSSRWTNSCAESVGFSAPAEYRSAPFGIPFSRNLNLHHEWRVLVVPWPSFMSTAPMEQCSCRLRHQHPLSQAVSQAEHHPTCLAVLDLNPWMVADSRMCLPSNPVLRKLDTVRDQVQGWLSGHVK